MCVCVTLLRRILGKMDDAIKAFERAVQVLPLPLPLPLRWHVQPFALLRARQT